VFVENVRQEPTTAYAVSGTTLTFTAAPVTSSGNNIYVLHMNPTTTTTHPSAQNLTAVDGTFTGDVSVADDLTVTDDVAITGKTGMGISSTDVPDGGLHIHTGSSGSVSANAHGDQLVVESSGRGGISILTPDANESNILFGSPSDNLGGFITYKQSNTTMELGTSIASGLVKVNVADGTLNTTFEADGDVNISNGNLVVASGHGIDFSATGNATGANQSELLDDYEEGTWTPTLPSGGTIDTISGSTFTKIGKVVHIGFYIAMSSIPNNSTTFYIGGLPYVVAYQGGSGGESYYGAGAITYVGSHDIAAFGMLPPTPWTSNDDLYFHRGDGNNNTVKNSDMTGCQYLIISTVYVTNS